MKDFAITKVVTRNLIVDSFQSIRNTFGMRLRGYESVISKTIKELQIEMRLRYQVKWYRMSINPLTNGSIMITIYGVGRER